MKNLQDSIRSNIWSASGICLLLLVIAVACSQMEEGNNRSVERSTPPAEKGTSTPPLAERATAIARQNPTATWTAVAQPSATSASTSMAIQNATRQASVRPTSVAQNITSTSAITTMLLSPVVIPISTAITPTSQVNLPQDSTMTTAELLAAMLHAAIDQAEESGVDIGIQRVEEPSSVPADKDLTDSNESESATEITQDQAFESDDHQSVNARAPPVADGIERTVRVPVLMYHYLSVPPVDADVYRQDLSVDPDLFEQHLSRMQDEGYTSISLYDLYDHLKNGAGLPEKPVILTFDDGYRDNYTNAFPLLLKYGMQATFFIVTDFIDEERSEYVSWDMVREMRDAGMSIESHGRNHASLKGRDNDYLIWQALGSLETIEFELGNRPRFVSYPAGQYDNATMDIFASAGYWAGFTTIQGATHSGGNLFELRRVRIRGTTGPDELLRLLGLDW